MEPKKIDAFEEALKKAGITKPKKKLDPVGLIMKWIFQLLIIIFMVWCIVKMSVSIYEVFNY